MNPAAGSSWHARKPNPADGGPRAAVRSICTDEVRRPSVELTQGVGSKRTRGSPSVGPCSPIRLAGVPAHACRADREALGKGRVELRRRISTRRRAMLDVGRFHSG